MPIRDELGTRMKENYEMRARTYLTRRMPVAIRLDMCAGHTFTRGLRKPEDGAFTYAMKKTMLELCKHIQGAYFGYTTSDEITILLQDYKKLNTQAWFDYQVQKICSVAASMAANYFNRYFRAEAEAIEWDIRSKPLPISEKDVAEQKDYIKTLKRCVENGAIFDARCFNIPKEEVVNLIYWRQLDAMRNSVNCLAQQVFSHNELQGKSCAAMKEMLREKGCAWEHMPVSYQRGAACYRTQDGGWYEDSFMPILGEDRNYLEKLIG